MVGGGNQENTPSLVREKFGGRRNTAEAREWGVCLGSGGGGKTGESEKHQGKQKSTGTPAERLKDQERTSP